VLELAGLVNFLFAFLGSGVTDDSPPAVVAVVLVVPEAVVFAAVCAVSVAVNVAHHRVSTTEKIKMFSLLALPLPPRTCRDFVARILSRENRF